MKKSALKLKKRNLFKYSNYFIESDIKPLYITSLGALFDNDCLIILPKIKSNSIDTVFADPPFNLGKKYRNSTNDSLPKKKYLSWCKHWINECCRVLKPGGAFFLYNLPKWNIVLGNYLYEEGMQFRHWIAIELSACLPIKNKLHPSHYSLLYYTKGTPKTFRRIRIPIKKCRHCDGEIKDYGGHRKAMNPKGVTLKDVWDDIPSVRHKKFKSRNRNANALSTKLLDRIIETSTEPGDLILDPFGGSGTTFACAEYKRRKWIGIEIDYSDDIIHRLKTDEIKPHRNDDYIDV